MLLKICDLEGIAAGKISLAFRRWKRPTVKAGGQLRTAIGILAIDALDAVEEGQISEPDARRAGFGSRDELIRQLARHGEAQPYRISLRFYGTDPRTALRQETRLTDEELRDIAGQLDRFDGASRHGAWTLPVLGLIARSPGLRAADLAAQTAYEKLWLKTQIRKLKDLGLTESLPTGYRLSPRGRAFLEFSKIRGG